MFETNQILVFFSTLFDCTNVFLCFLVLFIEKRIFISF